MTQPDAAVAAGTGGTDTVYASWNGATDVAAWRVLAGSVATALRSVAQAPRTGFETAITVPAGFPVVEVQALSSSGEVLATSAPLDGPGPGATDTAGAVQPAAAPSSSTGSAGSTGAVESVASGAAANSAPACPRVRGALSGQALGALKLGMSRAQARDVYPTTAARDTRYEDFFCLTPVGVRVGYASPGVLRSLAMPLRAQLAGRAIWLSSANPRYAFGGVHATMPIATAAAALDLEPPFRVGANTWYLTRPTRAGRQVEVVLKVRRAVVQEIGIADPRLTLTRSAQLRFLTSFG